MDYALTLPKEVADEMESSTDLLVLPVVRGMGEVAVCALAVMEVTANVVGVAQAPHVLPAALAALRRFLRRSNRDSCILDVQGPSGRMKITLSAADDEDIDAVVALIRSTWKVPHKATRRR